MLPALLLRDLATNKSAFTSATLILRTLSLTTRKIAKYCNTAQITLFLSPADLPRAVLCLQHSGCYQTQMGKKKMTAKQMECNFLPALYSPCSCPSAMQWVHFVVRSWMLMAPSFPWGSAVPCPAGGCKAASRISGRVGWQPRRGCQGHLPKWL